MGASLHKSAIFVSDVPWSKPSSELGDPPFMERLSHDLSFETCRICETQWITNPTNLYESREWYCGWLRNPAVRRWFIPRKSVYIIFYHTCTYEITRENPWRMVFALHKGHASFLVWWSGGTLLLGTLWRMRSLCTDLRFSEAGQPWKVSVSMEVSMGKTWQSHGNVIYEWRFNETILYR